MTLILQILVRIETNDHSANKMKSPEYRNVLCVIEQNKRFW